MNYELPYKWLVGGVLAMTNEHFYRVNGFSNLYCGWGGEDDDMAARLEPHTAGDTLWSNTEKKTQKK